MRSGAVFVTDSVAARGDCWLPVTFGALVRLRREWMFRWFPWGFEGRERLREPQFGFGDICARFGCEVF